MSRLTGRAARSLIGLVAVMAIASPALASHGGIHPTFRSERVYFHCNGATKVQNVNWFLGTDTSWDTTPPAQSLQQGGGCGHADGAFYGTSPNTPYDAVFVGTFTGNISSMTLELHNLLLSRARAGATYDIGLRVSIDGEHLFGTGTTQGRRITMTPVLGNSGLTEMMRFSVGAIGCAREVKDAEGRVINVITDGVATEDGNGQMEHEIVVTVDQWFLDRFAAWVWDANEVPSGITFNASTLATPTVQPDIPANCT